MSTVRDISNDHILHNAEYGHKNVIITQSTSVDNDVSTAALQKIFSPQLLSF